MKTIASKDNAKLKAVRALVRSKKERQETSCFVMEGVRALSALKDGTALPQYSLKEIWVSNNVDAFAGVIARASSRYADAGVPMFEIPHEFMEQLSDCHTSQGVLGVVEYTPVPLEIHPDKGRYLLLDRLMDPGNMGTLIRSAVAFGFDGVLLHGDCVEVFNPKTVRATMGALPFCRFAAVPPLAGQPHSVSNHWKQAEPRKVGIQKPAPDCSSNVWKNSDGIFQTLEKLGYEIVVTVLRGGEDLYKTEFGPKTVLVIGNEANGISDEILERSTRRLSIPMSGNVESLNAAVAGSICMSALGR